MIIALWCYVGFCHRVVWICQNYTYVPSLLNLPLPLHHPTSLGCYLPLGWAFVSHSNFSLSLVVQLFWFFVTPWTVAHQAPLSMGFSRQEYWSGVPFPSPEGLPDPVIKLASPELSGRFFTIWATWASQLPLHYLFYIWVRHHFKLLIYFKLCMVYCFFR